MAFSSPDPSAGSGTQSEPNHLESLIRGRSDKNADGRDGQAPKRRGPKPDSKPALTRRQELNRQAQRTHRERKEQYVKALEDEVMRMKEMYTKVTHERDSLLQENQQLREALSVNGLPLPTRGDGANRSATLGSSQFGSDNSRGTPQSAISPFPAHSPAHSSQQGRPSQQHQHQQQQKADSATDSEQAGIDFVLALERSCMQHMSIVSDALLDPDTFVCGHALMASCPPPAKQSDVFGRTTVDAESGQQTWELSKGELAKLLDLSSRLELDGEITPVVAWKMLLSDPRVARFEASDFQELIANLKDRVRCYGFGAVMEEWELRDALDHVLSRHPEVNAY